MQKALRRGNKVDHAAWPAVMPPQGCCWQRGALAAGSRCACTAWWHTSLQPALWLRQAHHSLNSCRIWGGRGGSGRRFSRCRTGKISKTETSQAAAACWCSDVQLHLAKPILVFLAEQQGFAVPLFNEMKRLQQQPESTALQGSCSDHQPDSSCSSVADACSRRRYHAIVCSPLELSQEVVPPSTITTRLPTEVHTP